MVLTGGVSAHCEALGSSFRDFAASVVPTVVRE